jgi:hypothetical protein
VTFMEGGDGISLIQQDAGTETMQTVLHVARMNGWTTFELVGVLVLFIASRGLTGDLAQWIRRRSAVRLPPSHGTA